MPDLLIDGKWFPRNERDTRYELTPKYFKRDNKGNNGQSVSHRDEVEGGLDKDPVDGKHGKSRE